MADLGTGTTITFGTSGWSASITGINHDNITRVSVPTSHLATTSNHTFIPGDLVDRGEVTLDFQFDPDTTPPIASAAETITITFPIPSGATAGATFAFTGFMTDWSYGVPLEDLMTGTGTIKLSGAVTETASS